MYRIFSLFVIGVFLSACVEANTTAEAIPEPESPRIMNELISTVTPVEMLEPTSTSTLLSFTPSQESNVTEQFTAPQASTSEEAVNEGLHSYSFKTEFECATVVTDRIEKFRITFFQASVALERLEPEPPWTQRYKEVSNNTYAANVETDTGKLVHITVEFNRNGFTMFSAQQHNCGRYIRTLLQ